MATNRPGKMGWLALLAPLVIVPVAYFAALPWLERQANDALSDWITAAFGFFVIGYSVFVATRVNRRLDEVEIAGQRFASTQGMAFGTIAAVLVIAFPPSMDMLMKLVNTVGAESPEKAVRIGIVLGFMLVVLLQAVAMIAVSIWWGRRITGPQA